MKEDRCVCCGDVIPEGRQVCPKCERMVGMGKPRMCGASAPYTATIPGRCKDCRYWSRNEIRDTDWGICCKIRVADVNKHENGFCDMWRAEDEL